MADSVSNVISSLGRERPDLRAQANQSLPPKLDFRYFIPIIGRALVAKARAERQQQREAEYLRLLQADPAYQAQQAMAQTQLRNQKAIEAIIGGAPQMFMNPPSVEAAQGPARGGEAEQILMGQQPPLQEFGQTALDRILQSENFARQFPHARYGDTAPGAVLGLQERRENIQAEAKQAELDRAVIEQQQRLIRELTQPSPRQEQPPPLAQEEAAAPQADITLPNVQAAPFSNKVSRPFVSQRQFEVSEARSTKEGGFTYKLEKRLTPQEDAAKYVGEQISENPYSFRDAVREVRESPEGAPLKTEDYDRLLEEASVDAYFQELREVEMDYPRAGKTAQHFMAKERAAQRIGTFNDEAVETTYNALLGARAMETAKQLGETDARMIEVTGGVAKLLREAKVKDIAAETAAKVVAELAAQADPDSAQLLMDIAENADKRRRKFDPIGPVIANKYSLNPEMKIGDFSRQFKSISEALITDAESSVEAILFLDGLRDIWRQMGAPSSKLTKASRGAALHVEAFTGLNEWAELYQKEVDAFKPKVAELVGHKGGRFTELDVTSAVQSLPTFFTTKAVGEFMFEFLIQYQLRKFDSIPKVREMLTQRRPLSELYNETPSFAKPLIDDILEKGFITNQKAFKDDVRGMGVNPRKMAWESDSDVRRSQEVQEQQSAIEQDAPEPEGNIPLVVTEDTPPIPQEVPEPEQIPDTAIGQILKETGVNIETSPGDLPAFGEEAQPPPQQESKSTPKSPTLSTINRKQVTDYLAMRFGGNARNVPRGKHLVELANGNTYIITVKGLSMRRPYRLSYDYKRVTEKEADAFKQKGLGRPVGDHRRRAVGE